MLSVMKWFASALPAALGAVVGCVVGVIATRPGASSDEAPRPLPAQAERAFESEDAEPDEIGPLAARIRSLEQRVSLLTAALGAARGETAAGTGEPASELTSADVADPVFEAAVRDLLDRIDDERREERTERTRRRAGHGAQRVADRLTQELGLTERQQQELLDIFKAHYETLATLRDQDATDAPATPGEWRARMAEIRQSTDTKLEEALTPAQLEKYRNLDTSEFFGGPRRRRAAREGSR